jgi:hypothetical protein
VQHEIPVQGQPYQIVFTRAFGYVRSLGSERVSMIDLLSLGAGKKPIMLSFAAGAVPPKAAGDLVIADSIAPAAGDAGVLVVNPGDNTTYFYMEGMNATSSNYQTQGASARAVAVIDRSLHEVEPGVYASRVKMPAAGRFDVAFSLDSPRMLHCFSTEAAANPRLADARKGIKLDYLVTSREVKARAAAPVRFRITDGPAGAPRTGLADLRVVAVRVPGQRQGEVVASEIGAGVYEAQVPFGDPGAYYVYVASRSLNKPFQELPFLSLRASAASATAQSR